MADRSKINPLEFTLDFQFETLKFFVSPNDFYLGAKYLDIMDADCYSLEEHAFILDSLQKYKKQYGTIPKTHATFVQFLEDNIPDSTKTEVKQKIYKEVRQLYTPFVSDTPIVIEKIVEYGQYVLTANLFKEYAGKLREGGQVIKQAYADMAKIVKLADSINVNENEVTKGAYLVKDFSTRGAYKPVQGDPTFLKALNRMTSAGGFYAPQLIIFMGAPKGFKTGTMLNIALGYVKDGEKVFYADFENSVRSINTRANQGLVGASFDELRNGDKTETVKSIMKHIETLGGEMRIEYFQANVASIADVEARLVQLAQEDGFVPTKIIYDGLDLVTPIDKSIRDKRLQIQATYHDAIRLQTKYCLTGFTPSQVSRQAISKPILNMQDLSEDIGKAHNAHAAFAICRTDEEIQAGTARIVPVFQREGVRQEMATPCFVKIDEARMLVEEIDINIEGLLSKRDNIRFRD